MKELIIEEKKYFWLNPNLRLDFYIVNVTALLLVFVGILFKELYLIILAFIGFAFEIKSYIKLFKTFKAPARKLAVRYTDNEFKFEFDGEKFSIPTEKLDRLIIIIDPQESKKRRTYYYKIVCQCGKKDKEIAKLPASILAGENIDKLEKFIKENAKDVDIILMKTEDLY